VPRDLIRENPLTLSANQIIELNFFPYASFSLGKLPYRLKFRRLKETKLFHSFLCV